MNPSLVRLRQYFFSRIKTHFMAVDRPVAVILVGQPGAGKIRVTQRMKDSLDNNVAVHVFENMWLAAINTASKRFEGEKKFLNNQLVEFQVQLEQALNDKMMLENTLKEQQNISHVAQEKLILAQDIIQERDITIKEQKAVIAALENAIESERSNNEKLHEKHTFELNKSVERLNGMQKHMLSQVEAARLEANLRIQAESDKFKANENSWVREKMMLESSYFKTKQELEQAKQQIMCFQKELKDLQAWHDKADQSNPVKRLRRKISRPPFNQSIKTFRRLDK